MESWLPWLVDDERVLPDLVGPGGRIVLVDPRRIRDRAAELNDEEAALAGALAVTWGVVESAGAVTDDGADEDDPSERFPRLNVAFERLLGRSVGAGAVDGAGGRVTVDPRPSWPGASSRCTATGPCWRRGCRSWWRAATR